MRKKFLKSAAILVCGLGLTNSFTACGVMTDTPIDPDVTTVEKVVLKADPNTLTVSANVEANFTLNGETKTGVTATFENVPEKGTVTISATDRREKEVNFFFSNTNVLTFDVTLESNAVQEVAQTEVNAAADKSAADYTTALNSAEAAAAATAAEAAAKAAGKSDEEAAKEALKAKQKAADEAAAEAAADAAVAALPADATEEEKDAAKAAAKAAQTVFVENAATNASETEVGAAMSFTNVKNDNAAATGDYSVAVFTPASEKETVAEVIATAAVETPEEGQETVIEEAKQPEVKQSALAVECLPKGAEFKDAVGNPKAVTLSMEVLDEADEDEDLEMSAVYENEDGTTEEVEVTVDGKNVNFDVEHFSIWSLVMKAKLVKIATRRMAIDVPNDDIDLIKGRVYYTSKAGVDVNNVTKNGKVWRTWANNKLLSRYIRLRFGKLASDFNTWFTFTPAYGATSASAKVSQRITDYTFKSGKVRFTVSVYGDIDKELTIVVPAGEAGDVQKHSGGSND